MRSIAILGGMSSDAERQFRRILLGLGLDRPDGELLRITRGENFHLIGGSKPTHEGMQEVCIRFNEEARRRLKTLDELSADEFLEIAMKLGLRPPPRRRF